VSAARANARGATASTRADHARTPPPCPGPPRPTT
jgi:hypothetical protein